MHIKKDDQVAVIAGDNRDITRARRVIRVIPDENRVVVEGVNLVYKHLKPSRRNPQGGRLSKEMPVAASNLLLYCPVCKQGVRIGCAYDETDGHKYRYCKRCKKAGKTTNLGRLSKARPAYARKK